jgi:arylsulfatase A-like enzyme
MTQPDCASLQSTHLRRVIVALLSALIFASVANGADPKPNFIVILSDDQGWGTTSIMMDPRVPESRSDFFQTPSLERLAAAGMRFTDAYASHCNCSPSRAALLTGRSPAALHLTDIIDRNNGPDYVGNVLIPPHHITDLSSDDHTIPELLKAFDPSYRAAHLGKWHLACGGPEKHGLDVSDGATSNANGKGRLPDNPKKIFGITRRAIEFMNAQVRAGHPFYLQVSHYATHEPWQARPASIQKFQNAPKGARHTNVEYAAMLFDLDEGIGQLFDAVQAAGIADHTYLIYTSDNGCIPTHDPGNINGPVRGWKASVWEGGIRVPFIVVGPGIKPGSVSRTPIVGYDIFPTICDFAGITSPPKPVEGGSLKAVLLGDGSAPVARPEDYLVFHWPHYQHEKKSTPDSTILGPNGWKLHYWWETKQVQLFHLDEDLSESHDLSAGHAEQASRMKTLLFDYLGKVNAQLPVPNPQFKGLAPAKPPEPVSNRTGSDD